jgi:hypothetical protein
MKRKIAAVLSAGLLVVASLYGVLFTAMPPATPFDDHLAEEPVKFALQYFSWIKARDWQRVKAASDQSLQNPSAQRTFEKMADILPPAEPTAIHLIGKSWVKSSSKPERHDITLEYLYPGKPLVANIVMDQTASGFVVMGAHFTPVSQPLEQYYVFRAAGQSRTHYTVAAVAALLIIVNAYALARCIMMPGLRRRWLWIIFVLLGWGTIGFNWTEATFGISPLFVGVPVVRVAQSAYQPLVIGLSLPLGALIFVFRRRQRDPAIAQFE